MPLVLANKVLNMFLCLSSLLLCLLNCSICNDVNATKALSENSAKYSQVAFEEISSIKEVPVLVNGVLQKNSSQGVCWIVFDVDYTLTMPMLVQEDKTYLISKENLLEAVADITDNGQFDRAISATLFFPQKLIDDETPEILSDLRKKGTKVFALTAAVGSKKHKQTRAETLNVMGVTFDDAFNFSETSLDDIPYYVGQRPSFFNGILYANGEKDPNNDKGIVLTSFMKKVKQYPSCVIVIDDRKKNLEDIKNSLEGTGIQFFGILYINANKSEKAPINILKKRISDVMHDNEL